MEGRVNPIDISIKEWEEFLKSPFWGAILFEIEERDRILMKDLRTGEGDWTVREIRSRLSELEYIKTLPSFIILDLEVAEKEVKKESN